MLHIRLRFDQQMITKGDTMSRSTHLAMNKHQNHPKVRLEQYLFNSDEPEGGISFHISPELEAEMLDSNLLVRRRIKNQAQRMREQFYSN